MSPHTLRFRTGPWRNEPRRCIGCANCAVFSAFSFLCQLSVCPLFGPTTVQPAVGAAAGRPCCSTAQHQQALFCQAGQVYACSRRFDLGRCACIAAQLRDCCWSVAACNMRCLHARIVARPHACLHVVSEVVVRLCRSLPLFELLITWRNTCATVYCAESSEVVCIARERVAAHLLLVRQARVVRKLPRRAYCPAVDTWR
jgi:hypothetical protein